MFVVFASCRFIVFSPIFLRHLFSSLLNICYHLTATELFSILHVIMEFLAISYSKAFLVNFLLFFIVFNFAEYSLAISSFRSRNLIPQSTTRPWFSVGSFGRIFAGVSRWKEFCCTIICKKRNIVLIVVTKLRLIYCFPSFGIRYFLIYNLSPVNIVIRDIRW